MTPELEKYISEQILQAKAELIVSFLQQPHVSADDARVNWLAHSQALEDGAYEDIVSFRVAKFGYRRKASTEVK